MLLRPSSLESARCEICSKAHIVTRSRKRGAGACHSAPVLRYGRQGLGNYYLSDSVLANGAKVIEKVRTSGRRCSHFPKEELSVFKRKINDPIADLRRAVAELWPGQERLAASRAAKGTEAREAQRRL